MKAALIFTGSGPILVLTAFDSFQSPDFVERLAARGISKFIAHEVPVDLVEKRYGTRFSVVVKDLSQKDDLRVMDIDGHHVFRNFSFEEIGPPVYSHALPLQKSAGTPRAKEETEADWLWAEIDEYGKLIESSFVPMTGSKIVPTPPVEASAPHRRVRFKIDDKGVIFEASPGNLNGRKVVLHGRSSPALGRSDTVTPACTWKADATGGWTCG